VYVGPIVAVGATPSGLPAIAYRISSRSHRDRTITVDGDRGQVHQRDEDDPYVEYECARVVGPLVVVGNGSHVSAMADRLQAGSGPFDAAVLVLAALGHHQDGGETPRIAAVAGVGWSRGLLATMGGSWLQVEWVDLVAGTLSLVSAYDETAHITEPRPLAGATGEQLAAEVLAGAGWQELEHPVASLAAIADGSWQPATADAVEPSPT
jgi:IMP cyclohydrolase